MTDKNDPIGDRLRHLFNEALNSERKSDVQLEVLNDLFEKFSIIIPSQLAKHFGKLLDDTARMHELERNDYVIAALTQGGADGTGMELIFSIPVNTRLAIFELGDIVMLPGYKMMHEVLRAQNVAMRLEGLIDEDARGRQAMMILNVAKSYQDGADEYPQLYPELPPRPQPPKNNGDFDAQKPKPARFD